MDNKYLNKIAVLILLFYSSTSYSQHNYEDALAKSVMAFDANKCGPNAGTDNVNSWRGACHVNDGSTVGLDLTGGYHDAGDHVKFGVPQTWSAATLGFALYEFKPAFDKAGITAKALSTIKYFTDYFLKCNVNANTFYYHVGDGNVDHAYWGAPEQQTGSRPVIAATPSTPASDVCGEAAAALALMYLNYKDIDAAYATRCLNAAKQIFTLGKNNVGRSSDGSGGSFYNSGSHFDDLAWGAIWLAIATGDRSYLTPVDGWLSSQGDIFNKHWSPEWNDATLFGLLKMYDLTKEQKYYTAVSNNLTWFRTSAPKTPAGLPWILKWGSLRYASAEAGYGYLAAKNLNYTGYNATADLTINYILGTNPRKSSYLTNWGTNPPRHPHHRANEPIIGGPTKGMLGALVGGPDMQDNYVDNVQDYVQNEVAIDYQASVVFGLAGKLYFTSSTTNIPPTATLTSPSAGNYPIAPLTLSANASDSDGTIAKVEFFSNGTKIGEDATSPYSFTWNVASAGNYSLTAVATDNKAATGTSSAIVITITTGSSVPVTSITSPSNGASFVVGTAINISSNASTSVGTVSKVEFFANGTKLGEDATSPYTYSWTNAAIGTHALTSVVTNSAGTKGTSAPVSITVTQSGGSGCNFGTPLPAGLPSLNASYTKVYKLGGTGGPNLSNVSNFTINWDLSQNGLWQLSVNTSNGQPSWWKDLKTVATARFNQANPDITFTNSGFPGLDGQYWVAKTGVNFVLVSKTGGFTLYFTNSATAPVCTANARVGYEDIASLNKVSVYPNPFRETLHITIEKPELVRELFIHDQLGRVVVTVPKQDIKSNVEIRNNMIKGIYILKMNTTFGIRAVKITKE